MINLTEQWGKGELPSGFYYIRRGLSKRIDMSYLGGAFFEGNIEVILPVPSYEQWQEYKNANDSMFDTIKMLNKDNYKLEKENTKIKGLLKEVRGKLKYINTPRNNHNIFGNDLMKKINQVLGEE